MNAVTKKAVIKILTDVLFKVENDTCGLDDEELMEIANNLVHVKMNIEKTCKHLNCSRASLNRMIIDKRVPKPHKDQGGREYWYQDELDEYIKSRK